MKKFNICLILFVLICFASGHAMAAPELQIENGKDLGSFIDKQLKQISLLEKQGQGDRAIQELQTLLPVVRSQGNRSQLIAALNNLGALHIFVPMPLDEGSMATNKSVRSVRILHEDYGSGYLSEALALAREDGDTKMSASILNNIGTLYMVRKQYDQAIAKYSESIKLARQNKTQDILGSALINTARLNLVTGSYEEARAALAEARLVMADKPDTLEKAEALAGIGQIYRKLALKQGRGAPEIREKGIAALQDAFRIARILNNARLMSYALGYQGGIAEDSGNIDKALGLTRQALFSAQTVNAHDLLYLWQWQLGKLLNAGGDSTGAATAYRLAVHSLQKIRNSVKPESFAETLSFRDMVEPVYLELTSILLKESEKAASQANREKYLTEVRDIIESLRTAELQDYMKDSCIGDTGRGDFFKTPMKSATAVVYLITMPSRLEILLNLPSGIRHFSTVVEASSLNSTVINFVNHLTTRSGEYLGESKKLYDIIIRPIEAELAKEKVEHLIIIPDGSLRSIPMAALHDGSQFLLDKFAVSTTQGIQLVNTTPPVIRQANEMLMAGISDSIHDMAPLPNVRDELGGLKTLYDGTTLLNADFKMASLKNEIERKPYSYIHLATHGEFAGGMHNMFILAYDGLIDFDQLDKYIKVTKYRSEPLELLSLSACKTAVGDDQAALGLAGIAVKAGAKSTVATLWEIDDKATSELIIEFYRVMKESGKGKAKALQYAQQQIMKKYEHPYFWSPFILIGNWL